MSCKSLRLDAGVLTGLVIACAVIWMVLASAPRSHAIPAFSRKYQTSCTTCHNNYPELNDFGEAFKKNGFKFPKDDDVFVKQDPVLLGSKAQKEAFPEAVYPGEIPGTLPIAFRYSGNFNWNAKQPSGVNQTSSFLPRTDLFVPNTFTIISAGSFGPNLSFWIDDDVSTGGSGANGGLGDGYLKYNDLGRIFHLPKDSLNVRFGQFELDLPFTQARTIYLSDYDVYDQVNVAGANGTTNNPFTLGAPQRAIEFSGYPNDGNFSWSVAITNGNNDGPALRNTKDVYIRVSQKFNLESDAESRHAIQAAGPTGPRDHTSIRIGGFFYHGTNVQNIGATPPPFPGGSFNESFYRAGADVALQVPSSGAVRLGNGGPRRQSRGRGNRPGDSREGARRHLHGRIRGGQLLVLPMADRHNAVRLCQLAHGFCQWCISQPHAEYLQPGLPDTRESQRQDRRGIPASLGNPDHRRRREYSVLPPQYVRNWRRLRFLTGAS